MQIGDICCVHEKGLMSDHNASHEGQIQQQNSTTPSTASHSVACFLYSLRSKMNEDHLCLLDSGIPAWHIHM
jgi:hypothetical protein